MPRTALGLFGEPQGLEEVIREIEALGIPRNEIRTVMEPATFEITSLMSFPRLDFEVDLRRDLIRIGATRIEAELYVEGLRRGGVLLLATAPEGDAKIDAAAEIMNRYGALGTGETTGAEPHLPHVARGALAIAGNAVLEGRVRQPEGACIFVW